MLSRLLKPLEPPPGFVAVAPAPVVLSFKLAPLAHDVLVKLIAPNDTNLYVDIAPNDYS